MMISKTYSRPSHVQRAIFRLVATVAHVRVTEERAGMTVTTVPGAHETLRRIIADVSAAMKGIRRTIRRSREYCTNA